MKIVVDAMGGDHAPANIVAGVVEAVREYPVIITLVGNRDKVLKHCALLAAGLPPDAEEVDLSVVVRRFAAEQS